MGMRIKVSLLVSLLLGCVFFLYTNPYYVWQERQIRYFIEILGGIIMLCCLDIHDKNSKIVFIYFFIYYLYLIFIQESNVVGSLLLLSFLPLPFIDRKILMRAFDVFYRIYTLFLLLSIISYFFWMCGVSLPNWNIEPFNELKQYSYTAYPFLVIPNEALNLIRFHGIYEEPGNIGTVCALLLCSRKMDIKDWRMWSILFGGLLSLSLFFYIIFLIYIVWTLFLNHSKYSYRFLFSIVFLSIVYACFKPETILNQAIGERLSYDKQSGTLSGNNRNTESFKRYYSANISVYSPIFYFGSKLTTTDNEHKMIVRMKGGSASIQSGIVDYGCIAYVWFFTFYILFMTINKMAPKEKLFMSLIIFLTIWQRPFILSKEFNLIFCMWIINNSRIDMSSVCRKQLQHSSF